MTNAAEDPLEKGAGLVLFYPGHDEQLVGRLEAQILSSSFVEQRRLKKRADFLLDHLENFRFP